MSRIGNLPIILPEGIEFTISEENKVTIKSSKGELTKVFSRDLKIIYNQESREISVSRDSNNKNIRSLHGLTRQLLFNMVVGLDKGFVKELELVGVGYRANCQGQKLELTLGYSHNIIFEIPKEVKVESINEKGKNPRIKLSSSDNELLGLVAAKIRSLRKPEPYKGKGVRYVGEQIRRKAGKTAAAK
tara:strand:+ start:131 stop:694 length:564 start_codon:yes stop_codon:yes gene_type:complete